MSAPSVPFSSKVHDTKPLKRWLETKDASGAWVPFPLPGGSVVVFNMRSAVTGAVVVSRGACTIVQADADATIVQYAWGAGGNGQAGDFEGEFEVSVAGGPSAETFPPRGFIPVHFDADIA